MMTHPTDPRHFSLLASVAALAALGGCDEPPPPLGFATMTSLCSDTPDIRFEGQGMRAIRLHEASGPSRLLHMNDQKHFIGVASEPFEMFGRPVKITGPSTLFGGRFRGDIDSFTIPLFTGRLFHKAVNRDGFYAVMVTGDVSGHNSYPKSLDLPDDAPSVVMARHSGGIYLGSHITGDLDPDQLLMLPGPDGDILVVGTATSHVTITRSLDEGSPPLEARATTDAGPGGHAWVAWLDNLTRPRAIAILDGDAASRISSLVSLPDGRVALGGRFGGPGSAVIRLGQRANAPFFQGAGTDFDGFVAVLESTGEFEWGQRIRSANALDDDVVLTTIDGGFAAHLATATGETAFGETGPLPTRLSATHTIGVWTATADRVEFAWAQPTEPYRRIGLRAGIRTEIVDGQELWHIAGLDPDGTTIAHGKLTVLPDGAGPVGEHVQVACLTGLMLVGGSPRGRPTYGDPDYLLDLRAQYDVPEPHIVIVEAGY